MKKKKLFTLFTTLVLCLCTMAIGVYAAKTTTVTSNGSINFVATSINGTVDGTITGAAKVGSVTPASKSTAVKYPTLTFDASVANNGSGVVGTQPSGGLAAWTSNNVQFHEDATAVVLAITVKNTSTAAEGRGIKVTITNSSTGITVAMKAGSNTLASGGSATVAANSSMTFTITMTYTTLDTDLTGTYGFTIKLENVAKA